MQERHHNDSRGRPSATTLGFERGSKGFLKWFFGQRTTAGPPLRTRRAENYPDTPTERALD